MCIRDSTYPAWVKFIGEISMLLQTIVGGEPEAYMPPSLLGGLNNLNNYRRTFGISMGFLLEL
eukprot:8680397-Prorocentrum_lima.AAC.1